MTEQEKRNRIIWIVFWVGIIATLILLTYLFNLWWFRHEEGLVCVTKTGECYHSPSCHYLKSVIEKGLEQAKKAGYRACSYCGGKAVGTIIVNDYLFSFVIALFVVSLVGIFVASKISDYISNVSKKNNANNIDNQQNT